MNTHKPVGAHPATTILDLPASSVILHRDSGADKLWDQRLQHLPAVVVEVVVPLAHKRGDHRTRALGMVAERFAGDPRHGLHHAHAFLERVVSARCEFQGGECFESFVKNNHCLVPLFVGCGTAQRPRTYLRRTGGGKQANPGLLQALA
jgi:hypothetical protein